MYYSEFQVEFMRLTQGVGSTVRDPLTVYEPHIVHAIDRAIDHVGRMQGYTRDIDHYPHDCDRAIVWTSNDRRDVLIARVTEVATDCMIPWAICVDCIDAIYGLTDDPQAIERVAPELRRDTETVMHEADPEFSWCACDSCGAATPGSRATFLTMRKGGN